MGAVDQKRRCARAGDAFERNVRFNEGAWKKDVFSLPGAFRSFGCLLNKRWSSKRFATPQIQFNQKETAGGGNLRKTGISMKSCEMF
jgi:hypothetical protein